MDWESMFCPWTGRVVTKTRNDLKWPKMTLSDFLNDLKWPKMTQNDFDWFLKWLKMTQSDLEWYKKWLKMTQNDLEWFLKWPKVTKYALVWCEQCSVDKIWIGWIGSDRIGLFISVCGFNFTWFSIWFSVFLKIQTGFPFLFPVCLRSDRQLSTSTDLEQPQDANGIERNAWQSNCR